MRTTARFVAAVAVVALISTACSSRSNTSSTAASSSSSTGPKVALKATDTGITPTEIHIAVIADNDNAIKPGLFKVAFDGMKAWAAAVNARGGLAGRKVVVDELDSKLNPDEYRNAVISACKNDFALVGGIAIFDNAVDELKCGIPDMPGSAISADHRDNPTTFPVTPAKPGVEAVGGYKWYLDNIDGCCKDAVLIPNQPIARESTIQGMNAADEIGFQHVFDTEVAGEELNYTSIVLQIKRSGANYVRNGLDYTATVRMRKEAKVQGLDAQVKVYDCTTQCYTPNLISEGGDAVEGQYVQIPHVPFEEAGTVKAMQEYVKYVEKTGGTEASFGLDAYAAGLLLEHVVGKIVDADGPNGLTRAKVLAGLKDVHDFTANGLFGKTDIGAKQPSGCFVILQVKNGKFVRIYPQKAGAIDCGPDNLHQTHVVEPGGR